MEKDQQISQLEREVKGLKRAIKYSEAELVRVQEEIKVLKKS